MPALNLLPAEPEAAPASRLNGWLALIALALLVAAAAIPLRQQQQTAADLERQVAVREGRPRNRASSCASAWTSWTPTPVS